MASATQHRSPTMNPACPSSALPPAPSSQEQNHDQDLCTICLSPITARAIAYPCNHWTFDFICLATWTQARPTCPLCNATITAIQYDFGALDDFKTYDVPGAAAADSFVEGSDGVRGSRRDGRGMVQPLVMSGARGGRRTFYRPPPRRRREDSRRAPHRQRCAPQESGLLSQHYPRNSTKRHEDPALTRRRFVYTRKIPCAHIGSNARNRFRDFTAADVRTSPSLQARARAWIRRELTVFPVYDPIDVDDVSWTVRSPSPNASLVASNANAQGTKSIAKSKENAEFALEYIMAVLKSVDIKESNGRAAELVAPFLDGEVETTRLFLHELEAWLRSPFVEVGDWDAVVQYIGHDQMRGDVDERDSGRKEQQDGALA